MKQSCAIQRSGYNLSPLGTTVALAMLDFWVTFKCPGCFMTMILDIDDPDFLSCRHFCIKQQVFYNLELVALLLPNTVIYLINEIPSYLIVVGR